MGWMPWGQKMSLQVFLVWRLMMGPGDACKTHDGARGCMQDPPAKLGTLLRCSCKGLGLHATQGGLGCIYTCIWASITADMNIIHEHRLPQTWTSYTHTHIRQERRTSDMNIEHQTWAWTSDMDIEHHTLTSNTERRHCMYIIHAHRISDMNIEHQTNQHAWVCWNMQVHVCRVHAHLCMHSCMHSHECMHTHGWSGHRPCMRTYAFRPHELIPGCFMEL